MGGSSAPQADKANPALDRLSAGNANNYNPAVQGLLSKVDSGQMSIQDALSQAGNLSNTASSTPYLDDHYLMRTPDNSGLSGAALSSLATDPIAGSMLARDQVMKDPTLAGLFNDGGLLSQSENQYKTASDNLSTDRNALMGRDQSYGLNSTDLAAYGQGANQITNMFGMQGQNLAQNLANRGLGGGDSGIANQGFSNLYGNQSEQLAALQTNIAQQRINTAQQLAQARTSADLTQQGQAGQLSTNLGNLGQNAINSQFNRQLQGSENNFNQTAGAAGMNMQNLGLQQGINNAQWTQQQQTGFNPVSFLGSAGGAFAGGLAGTAGTNLAGGTNTNLK